jgi:hypothetical protein
MLSAYFQRLTRARLIATWFTLVAVCGAIAIVLRGVPSTTIMATLLTLAVLPIAIVMMLWPGVQPLTAAEVIRGERR